jgi:ADP-ribose pyrophosphatase YjhB (NUDIX family)
MRSAAIAIIRDNGLVVLVNEKGVWRLPGGHIDTNESLESALRREIKEELDIDIDIEKFIAKKERNDQQGKLNIYFFLCSSKNKSMTPGEEISDAKFISVNDMAHYCDKTVIEQWPEEIKKELGLTIASSKSR